MLTKYAGDQTLGEYFDGSIYGKERTAYRLFYQLLEGLQFLHRARLTHSDININNVMIGIDGNGTPKPTIVDFDTSTSFSVFNLRRPRKRIQGMPLAHPAPEFFSSSSYNLYKFDMWLLAAIFYQMTMNKPPIEGTIAGQSLSLVRVMSNKELARKYAKGEYPVVIPDHYPNGERIPRAITELLSRTLIAKSKERPTPKEFLRTYPLEGYPYVE